MIRTANHQYAGITKSRIFNGFIHTKYSHCFADSLFISYFCKTFNNKHISLCWSSNMWIVYNRGLFK
jgi:hypothetical protein